MHVLELERIKISIMPIEFLAGDTDTEKQVTPMFRAVLRFPEIAKKENENIPHAYKLTTKHLTISRSHIPR